MKKLIVVLGGLLAAQLVLAVAVNLSSDDYGAFQPQQKLLAFDLKAVDGLRIEDGKNSVVLRKRDGKWLLPETVNFPANAASVDKLLGTLAGLEKGWPVATTAAAAHRFKVSDDQFERRLSLLSNDKTLAELYVGTSPGFRKVNVRPADEDAIFTVPFETWEASAKADDWIDKTILTFAPDDVTRVEMPGYVLQRDKSELNIADLSDKESTNRQEAGNLLDKLAHLSIQSVLGTESKPEYGLDTPAIEIKVTRKDGKVLDYRFSKPKNASYYVLKRSDVDDYFRVAEYTVKPLKDAVREKLVQVQQPDKTPDQAAVGENKPTAVTQSVETVGVTK